MGQYVYYTGANYVSLGSANFNHQPDISPASWEYQPAADGIAVVNANDALIVNPTTNNNSRWGVSVTTYNGRGTDLALSTGVVVEGGRGSGNQYGDYDFEAVRHCRGTDLVGAVSSSFSNGCSFDHLQLSSFYAASHNNLSVHYIDISPRGAVGNVFYVSGASPRIDMVYVHDTASSYSTNAFEVQDSTNDACVSNVTVENAYNAITIGGAIMSINLRSIIAANSGVRINSGIAVPYVAWLMRDRSENTTASFDRGRPGC
jgi:hypothetical protein